MTTLTQRLVVLDWLRECGQSGGTVKELRRLSGAHHGQASATLSRLHRSGEVACLIERRGGCHVYVMPDQVNGRGTISERTRQPSTPDFEAFVAGYLVGSEVHPDQINRVMLRQKYDAWLASSKGVTP